MPVTPAHAAAAWPVSRVAPALPVAATVIGSLSPDFEYLLRLSVHSRIAHTWLGVAVFCVPVALLVWQIYERLIRAPLTGLLPPGLAARLPPRRASIWLGLLAVALGAVSHVVWDGLTHRGGWGPTMFPSLMQEVSPGLRGYRLLQHISTAVGTIAVVIWIVRWTRASPPSSRRMTWRQWVASLSQAGALLAVAVGAGLANSVRVAVRTSTDRWALFAAGAMAGLAVALLLFGLWHRAVAARR